MSEPLLRVRGLSKSFGDMQVLREVDLDVAAGEVVCVLGPSGCGKSTLLRCINHLTVPEAGLVQVGGTYLGREPVAGGGFRLQGTRELDRLRPKVGFVFQQFNLWPHLSVLDNVCRGPVRVRGVARGRAEAEGRALLSRFGLTDKANAFPDTLSGGQKQRVAIARALAMQPDLILFDEPTSALDPEMVGQVLDLLRELAETGMTMVLVTHEIGFARRVADRVVFMDGGLIVESGPAAQVLSAPESPRLRLFLRQLRSHAAEGGA